MKKFLFVVLLFATIVLKAQTALDTMYVYTTKSDTTTTWRIVKSNVPTKVGVFADGVMYEITDQKKDDGSGVSTAKAWNIINWIRTKSGVVLTTSQMVQILLFAEEEVPQWLIKTTRI